MPPPQQNPFAPQDLATAPFTTPPGYSLTLRWDGLEMTLAEAEANSANLLETMAAMAAAARPRREICYLTRTPEYITSLRVLAGASGGRAEQYPPRVAVMLEAYNSCSLDLAEPPLARGYDGGTSALPPAVPKPHPYFGDVRGRSASTAPMPLPKRRPPDFGGVTSSSSSTALVPTSKPKPGPAPPKPGTGTSSGPPGPKPLIPGPLRKSDGTGSGWGFGLLDDWLKTLTGTLDNLTLLAIGAGALYLMTREPKRSRRARRR